MQIDECFNAMFKGRAMRYVFNKNEMMQMMHINVILITGYMLHAVTMYPHNTS